MEKRSAPRVVRETQSVHLPERLGKPGCPAPLVSRPPLSKTGRVSKWIHGVPHPKTSASVLLGGRPFSLGLRMGEADHEAELPPGASGGGVRKHDTEPGGRGLSRSPASGALLVCSGVHFVLCRRD